MTIRIWDVATGTARRTLDSSKAMLASVIAISSDSYYVASANGFSGTVRIWSVLDGLLVRSISQHITGGVKSLAFSRHGGEIASVSHYGRVRIDKFIGDWAGRSLPRRSSGYVAFSSNGKHFACVGAYRGPR